jgi:zinc transport system ATP-binding protein
MNKLIEIKNVTAHYEGKPVLENVSLEVGANEFLVITGPNGGGKTTLLKLMLRLLPLTSGEILYYRYGKATSSLRIGYLPQMNPFDRQFPISVREVVASGLASSASMFGNLNSAQNEQIALTLEAVEMNIFAKSAIGELSGGQFQRALLARAIVSQPELLILDEPNTYLDSSFERRFYDMLSEINHTAAIVLVTHDPAAIQRMATKSIYVNKTIE